MILTEADKDQYFPSVTLSGAALVGAIARVQAWCESVDGAARRLEETVYSEIVVADRVLRLPYWPVVSVSSVAFEDGLGWQSLTEGQDYRLDRLSFVGVLTFASSRPRTLKITYTAGFDFTSDIPDVRLIKGIAGQLLTVMSGDIGLAIKALAEQTEVADIQRDYGHLDRTMLTIIRPLKVYAPYG